MRDERSARPDIRDVTTRTTINNTTLTNAAGIRCTIGEIKQQKRLYQRHNYETDYITQKL